MARVKSRKLTVEQRELAERVAAVRTRLGLPRKPLSQPELYQALRKRFGSRAPSLSTVKRWEQQGKLSLDDARLLAELGGCGLDWLVRGEGALFEGSKAVPGAPGSVHEPRSAVGGPEDWASAVGIAVARTLRHALERGCELRKVAQYLLDLSTRGTLYGFEEIRELVDLAQRYLWWDEQHPTGLKAPPLAPSPAPSAGTSSTEPGKGDARS